MNNSRPSSILKTNSNKKPQPLAKGTEKQQQQISKFASGPKEGNTSVLGKRGAQSPKGPNVKSTGTLKTSHNRFAPLLDQDEDEGSTGKLSKKTSRKEQPQGHNQGTSLKVALQLEAELSKKHQDQEDTTHDRPSPPSPKNSKDADDIRSIISEDHHNLSSSPLNDKLPEKEPTIPAPKFTPEQLERRAAAAKRRAEILHEVSNDPATPMDLDTREAYRAARGGPAEEEIDPSLEQKEQAKKQNSVKFSNPTGIELKDNQTRPFIHRFDLRIEIKATDSEEDCHKLLQKQLHLFFSMVLQADESALIPPYLTLDRASAGFKDLSFRYPVANIKGFTNVKRYFSRLFPRKEGGQFYCNLILALSKSPESVLSLLRQPLFDNSISCWRRPTDCEQVSEVGWLLYSSRVQEESRLSHLLSKMLKENIGVRWRPVRTTNNFRRTKEPNPPANRAPPVRALHIECDSTQVQRIKHKLAKLYGSSSKRFPDGTKMRLIPPYNTVISAESKEKYGIVVARQAAFTAKLCTGQSWEFSQNLLLDLKNRDSGRSLRTVLMDIKSSKFPDFPVFHAIDKAWGSDNGVNFNFLPENESEARMYISGLVPYVRDTAGEWYLNAFTTEAIETHQDSTWDPETKQISSTTDVWVKNTLTMDEELNYTEFPTEEPVTVQFDIPNFRQQQSNPSPIFKDHDSVSTFHSRHSDVSDFQPADEEMLDVQSVATDNPTQLQHTNNQDQLINKDNQTMVTQETIPSSLNSIQVSHNDLEVSGITEDSSRISLLEQQFKTITSNFTVMMEKLSKQTASNTENQHELYTLLRNVLQTDKNTGAQVLPPPPPNEEGIIHPSPASRQPSTPSLQANHLAKSDEASSSEGVAGQGS